MNDAGVANLTDSELSFDDAAAVASFGIILAAAPENDVETIEEADKWCCR